MRIFLGTLMLLLLVVPVANAETYIGYGGYIQSQSGVKGSSVLFAGSFYNNNTGGNVKVHTMNITFSIGVGSRIHLLNVSKEIPSARKDVAVNETYTDSMWVKLDFDPGIYNVSIFFQVSGGSEAIKENVYALSNQTFIIRGETNTQAVARGFLIFVVSLIGALILFVIYNKYIKK